MFISFTIFLSCSRNTSGIKKDSGDISGNELKRKELELKEKELELKEKELNKESIKRKRISQQECEKFLESWAAYQNNKVFPAYIKLYNTDFQGIKRTFSGKTSYFTYDQWITDKKKAFTSSKNLYVSAYNINIAGFDENNGETEVQFTQYYSSGDYSDEGTKKMKLSKNNSGEIIILKEEMLYAKEVIEEGC